MKIDTVIGLGAFTGQRAVKSGVSTDGKMKGFISGIFHLPFGHNLIVPKRIGDPEREIHGIKPAGFFIGIQHEAE